MRALIDVTPTAEQLSLFSRVNTGVEVMRGAAGSGKTTTGLLKLRSSIGSFLSRKRRAESPEPLRILVLTYNRTLSGYVSELARKQFSADADIELGVSTFAKWAVRTLGQPDLITNSYRSELIRRFGSSLGLDLGFLEEEIEYLTGRFLPGDLSQYLTARRDGRGGTPRMEKPMREALLNDVVFPMISLRQKENLLEWNDLAVELSRTTYYEYDIVIVDETQDFSANQIRAVMNQLAKVHAVTFILDTAQRIYARGFTWHEVGIAVRPENSFRLGRNYRNTKQIAAFAASLVNGIATDDDGTMPNFEGARTNGAKPLVLSGDYSSQVTYAIEHIHQNVDLLNESVAFLHPKGGRWFDYLRSELKENNLPFVEISREAEWPQGSENIALSTLHSSKGLEFDHVIILGLNAEVMPHGEGDDDDKLATLRRLLAMGIGRAKNTVVLGYKPTDKSGVINFLDSDTFEKVKL